MRREGGVYEERGWSIWGERVEYMRREGGVYGEGGRRITRQPRETIATLL